LEAKAKEAEARIELAEARIRAMRRTPALALRAQGGDFGSLVGSTASGPPPFAVPPPPEFPAPGKGPLVVPPKAADLLAPPPEGKPEVRPKDSEIFVRMIDASGEAPEAMVSVGPASYIVRMGDAIGSWQITGIGPNGIWITAKPNERIWRPLLAGTGAKPPEAPPGLSAAPAPGGHR